MGSDILTEVALVALERYLLLSIRAILPGPGRGEVQLSQACPGTTEPRMVSIVLTLAMIAAGSQPVLLGAMT
ncbi:hypothetical protein SAMN06295987_10143 [Novosphingobium mathurense]|uniref:Uncharacterized protein n=1 Tax=Novosphingobium mathurense TaxID=428990 RepID=A0A1U6GR92_9SPHN|nr:hypothetical protein SAMN06295987_10143 [Novosphingobium mathurense]